LTADRNWNSHYSNEKSDIQYPDENLVRLLKKNLPQTATHPSITAIDLGCGSGRHLKLLCDLRIGRIIGLDPSLNALLLSRTRFSGHLLIGDNRQLPIRNAAVDIVIAWGSLHYGRKEELPKMLGEISRILAPGGHLFATLRTNRDTYLKKGRHIGNDTWITGLADINGTIASFYREEELTHEFSLFGTLEYGLAERTLVGNTGSLISHWVVHAIK
jgi:ubiquinone/menaquinone biosynthesis C-methylase UbiE